MKSPDFPKNLHKKFPLFWEEMKQYLETHNKKIEIKNSSYLLNDGKCGGFCDGNRIVVAKKAYFFLETLCHEYCHLQQAVEESPLWTEDFWCLKYKISDFNKLYNLLLLERDCELRVLKLNEKWGFFNPKTYAQRTNTYLFFYHYVFLKRKWRISTTVYLPEIVSKMPSEIVSPERLQVIDMPMMAEYDRYFG